MAKNEYRPRISEALPTATTSFETQNTRLAGVMGTLEQGIESVLSDEGFAAYLRMLAKFHDYSYANTILIMTQRSDASRVNSYNRWKELGRQVVKGEAGIKIFYPKRQNVDDPETGEKKFALIGFGVGNVFDITQTEGEPLPERPSIVESEAPDEQSRQLNIKMSQWLIDEGLRLESKQFPGNAKGFYLPTGAQKAIVIRRGEAVDPMNVAKTKTLVHEAAHYVADHAPNLPKGDVETVAESSAFVVMARFGLDTGAYSFPYVAGWAKNTDVLKRNLSEIQKVSHKLISAIEGVADPSEGEEPPAPGRFLEEDEHLALRERLEWEGP